MNIRYDDAWIMSNYSGVCSDDFVREYNLHTEQNLSKETLRAHIRRKLSCASSYHYTNEQLNFILHNYPIKGMSTTTKEFNKRFGTNKTQEHIAKVALNRGVHVKHEVALKNSNPNSDKVGTIREEKSTGYLVIKTGDSYKDWTKYQRYVYEQAYGKIPKGYVVVFLDGNNRNFELTNLMAVPKQYVLYMNTFDMRTDCPELTKVAVKWCELYDLLKSKGLL